MIPFVFAQAADAASRVGVGRIVGGWDFVHAAYGVAWTGLALYALSLWVRRPRGAAPSPDSLKE
jgi:hypothetical protein